MKLFLSHCLYGVHVWHYFHAYMAAPGWAFIHAGCWTLEVDWDPKGRLAMLLPKFNNQAEESVTYEDTVLPEA